MRGARRIGDTFSGPPGFSFRASKMRGLLSVSRAGRPWMRVDRRGRIFAGLSIRRDSVQLEGWKARSTRSGSPGRRAAGPGARIGPAPPRPFPTSIHRDAVNTPPAPRASVIWVRAITLPLTAVALVLFVGSLRVGWPRPAYLLIMIAASFVFAYGHAARGRTATFWPLIVWITLMIIARGSFYGDADTLGWRAAQHYSVVVLSLLAPLLYLMWRSRHGSAAEREGPPPSPSLPTET